MLHLAVPGGYLIHGTDIDKIYGIGMQITHGCVRMYPEDIEALYNSVPVGTPVYMVKQPIKVGWLDNTSLHRSASRSGRRGNNAGAEIGYGVEAHSKSQYRQGWCVCRKPVGNWRGDRQGWCVCRKSVGNRCAARILPEFDRTALNQALTVLDGNPVAIYQKLAPQQVLPVALPAGHGSKGGYFHGV